MDEDDFDYDESDTEDDLDFDCGDDGEICQYAGTEWCDWQCPFHDEVFGLIADHPATPTATNGDAK